MWLALAKQQQDTMEVEIESPLQKRKLKIDSALKETDVVKKAKDKGGNKSFRQANAPTFRIDCGCCVAPPSPVSILCWK